MAPGYQIDDVLILQKRLAEAEAELGRQKERRELFDQHFRELLDAAPIMVWMAGSDAMCTFFNKAWLEFRGRSRDEEIGNGWTEGIHPDDRDICIETYLKAFSARQPFRMQFRLQRAGGDYCWIEDTGLPHVENGQFMGFLGAAVAMGITQAMARRRAARAEREVRVAVLQ